MLLPENPEKRPGLWDAVASQLAREATCFIINDGVGDPFVEAREPNSDMAVLALSRLQAAQICRISAQRGTAISPHFAGKHEGATVSLTEFWTTPSEGGETVDSEKLKRELETAVINLFFAGDGVSTVFVPLSIASWSMRDADVHVVQEGLVFRKNCRKRARKQK